MKKIWLMLSMPILLFAPVIGCKNPTQLPVPVAAPIKISASEQQEKRLTINLTDIAINNDKFFVEQNGRLDTVDATGNHRGTLGVVSVDYNLQNGILRLEGGNLVEVTKGSVISLAPTNILSAGGLRKITAIERTTGGLTAQTEQAALTDVIRNGRIEMKGYLSADSKIVTNRYAASGLLLSRSFSGRSADEHSSVTRVNISRAGFDNIRAEQTFRGGFGLTVKIDKKAGHEPVAAELAATFRYEQVERGFAEIVSKNILDKPEPLRSLFDSHIRTLALTQEAKVINDTSPATDFSNKRGNLEWSGNVGYSITAEVGLAFEVYILIDIEANSLFISRINQFETKITPKIYMRSDSSVNGDTHIRYKLANINGGRIPIFTGLWVSPVISAFVGLNGKADMDMTLGLAMTTSKGVSYRDSQLPFSQRWSLLNEPFRVYGMINNRFRSSFLAHPYVRVNIDFFFNDLAGPFIAIEPYGKLVLDISEQTANNNQEWWRLHRGVDFLFGVKGNLFGEHMTFIDWRMNMNDKKIASAGRSFAAAKSDKAAEPPTTAPVISQIDSSDRTITVDWLPVANTVGYSIYYGTEILPDSAAKIDNVTPPFSLTGLNNGQRYYIWLKSINTFGASGFSARNSGIPQMPPPPIPENIQSRAQDGRVDVSWNAVNAAVGYTLYYNTSATVSGARTINCALNHKTVTGLTNGTNYYFWVKAHNSGGVSAAGTMVRAVPISDAGQVTALSLTPNARCLTPGVTQAITVTVSPHAATTSIYWSSDNPAVATVDDNGIITTHQAGSATITATADNGIYATCFITVDELSGTWNIGDRGPGGGWIFHDKGNSNNGWRYLEAAPADIAGLYVWSDNFVTIGGTDAGGIGAGRQNTDAISANFPAADYAGNAANACVAGGLYDWYLPSRDELLTMYTTLHKSGLGDFANNGHYWSSTQQSQAFAWAIGFGSGSQNNAYKDVHYFVRPVRRFDK